jgi:hypothetical protein
MNTTIWQYTDKDTDEARLVELSPDVYLLEANEDQVWMPTDARRALRDALAATLPDEPSQLWVRALLDAYLLGRPLDFGGATVPADIRARLEATNRPEARTLPDEATQCICHTDAPNYEGPNRDCPVHGETLAYWRERAQDAEMTLQEMKPAPRPPSVLTRLSAPEGATISATIHGKATWRGGLLQLVTADGATRNIPGEAEVTVLAAPEPEPELLADDTELVDGMTARMPVSGTWTYDAPADVWQRGQASLSTRRLIEARAVIVR